MRTQARARAPTIATESTTANLLGEVCTGLVPLINAAVWLLVADCRAAGNLLTTRVLGMCLKTTSETGTIPLGLLRFTQLLGHRDAIRIPTFVATRGVNPAHSVTAIRIAATTAVMCHEALAAAWARVGRDADRGGDCHASLVPRDLATVGLDATDCCGAGIIAAAPGRMNLKAIAGGASGTTGRIAKANSQLDAKRVPCHLTTEGIETSADFVTAGRLTAARCH